MIVPWLEGEWRQLAARIAASRVPHALLVGGAAGLGKRAFVQQLVESLACERREEDGRACGRCRGCALLAAGTHPDVVRVGLLEDKQELLIDQVRALCERLSKTSQFGGLQVAVVDPADAMNEKAANALLKTLEEPASDTVIILVADLPARLPPTIRSRCQNVAARFPSRESGRAWLVEHGLDAGEADAMLDLAAGNPGLALAYARPEQKALRQSVVADLEGLLARKAQPAETAQRWVKDQPEIRLALAAETMRLASWRARAGASGQDALARLTARTDFLKVARWWDRANLVRDQLRTPLKADLLLLEVLRDFRDLSAARGN